MLGVKCSATDCTSGFDWLANGLMDLIYLNDGEAYGPAIIKPTPIAINAINRNRVFRNCCCDFPILLKKKAPTKNIVPPIMAMPGSPNVNEIPGLGKAVALTRVNTVNAIATYIGIVRSFLKKGSAIKNSATGMLKYWLPPHAPLARPSIKPPATAFGRAYLISLCLIAEMKRYMASKPKKRPNGSDLNHPRFPLWMMAGLNANKS